MRSITSALLCGALLAACSPTDDTVDGAGDGDMAGAESEPMATAQPSAETPDAQRATTIPASMVGTWRRDDLGRSPQARDCDYSVQANRDFEKVLTISPEGYSRFESSGKLMEVHSSSPEMIDATFDTTYADTPTTARQKLELQDDGALKVYNDASGDVATDSEYLRCPAE